MSTDKTNKVLCRLNEIKEGERVEKCHWCDRDVKYTKECRYSITMTGVIRVKCKECRIKYRPKVIPQ